MGSGQAHSEIIKEFFAAKGEMGSLIADKDWSQTPLGPLEAWPQSLRTALTIALDSRYPMAIWWGADFTLLYNDSWRPILGEDKHPEALGASGREVFKEIWHIIGPQMQAIAATGKAMYFDDLLLPYHRFGYLEEIYFTYSCSPIRQESGEIEGIFAAVMETTERVINERRIQTLKELGQASFGKSDLEVCNLVKDILSENRFDIPFAKIYLFSKKSNHLLSYMSFGIDAGPSFPTNLNFHSDTELTKLMKQATKKNKPLHFQLTSGDKTSELPWGEGSRSAVIVPCSMRTSNQPYGFIIIGVNVRHRLDAAYEDFYLRVGEKISHALANARSFDEERTRAEILTKLDKAKTIFFSNISHEFRTPLTLLLGPLENAISSGSLLLEGDDLQLVYRSSQRLLKLVNTLLDFSRIEAGKIQAHYEPIELGGFSKDLASTFRSTIEKAGLKYEVKCHTLEQPVFVDRDMWEHIVINLISNAFKFTHTGKIKVILKQNKTHAQLRVEDTGIGISLEDLPKIFDRFHRGENIPSRSQEGSGIGLALVQELVKLHNGKLQVKSKPGRGSIFIVTLPFGTEHLPSDRIEKPRIHPSLSLKSTMLIDDAEKWILEENSQPTHIQAPQYHYNSNSKEPVRILLADDNYDMRSYLKSLLSKYWNVEAVKDGQAALDSALRAPPDLVLTDVMMPRLDGFQLVAKLRENPQTKEIPIILLSARAGEEAKLEGLASGADDYLLKPFSARELIGHIESSLKISRIRKETNFQLKLSHDRLESMVNERTKELAHRLNEREILLREIHHRVKNNLNVIASLLDLQCDHLSREVASTALRESQNRIQTIALVHEKLYQSNDLSRVDFQEYIHDLVDSLFLAYGANDSISYEISVIIPKINIALAIPCSLIISELVSNCLKHAFKEKNQAKIQVSMSLEKKTDNISLIVSDNGIGLPCDLDFKRTNTLGFKLIRILTRQLQGEINLKRKHETPSGASISITFPLPQQSQAFTDPKDHATHATQLMHTYL